MQVGEKTSTKDTDPVPGIGQIAIEGRKMRLSVRGQQVLTVIRTCLEEMSVDVVHHTLAKKSLKRQRKWRGRD